MARKGDVAYIDSKGAKVTNGQKVILMERWDHTDKVKWRVQHFTTNEMLRNWYNEESLDLTGENIYRKEPPTIIQVKPKAVVVEVPVNYYPVQYPVHSPVAAKPDAAKPDAAKPVADQILVEVGTLDDEYWAVFSLLVFLFIAFVVKYWRSNVRHKATLEELQGKLATQDDAVDEAIAKRNRLILERGALTDKPDTWIDSNRILVEVGPMDDEYWTVAERLQETMDDAHISSLWRIQNVALWTHYTSRKQLLITQNGVDTSERMVWHGTSRLDPSEIYNDQQDGFMMQYARDGYWGRGTYFAEKSSYSHNYAYKPSNLSASSVSGGRSVGKDGEREMFLVKLLVGTQVLLNRDESSIKAAECRALKAPPVNPRTGLKYNTVTGYTDDSQVWIVYENGRAYPEYLVRYYRGKTDP